MFSPSLMSASTESFSDNLARLAEAAEHADAIVVGAGAGLSTAAGFTYSGVRFERHLAPWEARYGFADMYAGGFHPYDTLEEYWGFWSRNALVNRYLTADAPSTLPCASEREASTDANRSTGVAADTPEANASRDTGAAADTPEANPLYRKLVKLLDGHDHFVITTNVDHQFQLAGIERERLYYMQGDYGLFQCSDPCHEATYDNELQVRAMVDAVNDKIARQRAAGIPEHLLDLSIPSELVPRCPRCGKPMSMNLHADATFVVDAGNRLAHERYRIFLDEHRRGNVLYLELGVGFNTPGIIKYPFWEMAQRNHRAMLASVNMGEVVAPAALGSRAILLNGDIASVIDALA